MGEDGISGPADDDREVLHGGVANAGQVVRIGDVVERPANRHSVAVHRFLGALHEQGFDGVPEPLEVRDGRERLRFVPGRVAVPPFPDWVQTDNFLASTTSLLARFHAASSHAGFPSNEEWSDELADPLGGPIVCHNDVCWENVVFRDGGAVALLDFDFAAPGRPLHDLAQFARMCVPVDDDVNTERLGWASADRPARLRLVCDTYGVDDAGRAVVLQIIDHTIERGGEFVLRHVQADDPGFVQMWRDMGGMERFDRRREWWQRSRRSFATALA
jgi:hypothetical protein